MSYESDLYVMNKIKEHAHRLANRALDRGEDPVAAIDGIRRDPFYPEFCRIMQNELVLTLDVLEAHLYEIAINEPIDDPSHN